MMWNSLSENSGTRAHSASHSGANSSGVASRQCERANSSSVTVSRPIGRMRRVRASMLPVIVHQARRRRLHRGAVGLGR